MKITEIKAGFQVTIYKLRNLFRIKSTKKRTRTQSQESESADCSFEDIQDMTRRNVHRALALSMGAAPESVDFAQQCLSKNQSSGSFGSKRDSRGGSHNRLHPQSSNGSGNSYQSHGRLGTKWSSASQSSQRSTSLKRESVSQSSRSSRRSLGNSKEY